MDKVGPAGGAAPYMDSVAPGAGVAVWGWTPSMDRVGAGPGPDVHKEKLSLSRFTVCMV